MRLLMFLILAILIAGCVSKEPEYYSYSFTGIEVKRSVFDFMSPDPKLNLDNMVVTKVKRQKGWWLKTPPDVDNPNVKVKMSVGSKDVEWNLRLDRGESANLRAELSDLPEEGVAYFIARGRDVNWRGEEQNTWHISDRKNKRYQVYNQQAAILSYVALVDQTSVFERVFSNYEKLISTRQSVTPEAKWLESKLSMLTTQNNLSEFLNAYNGTVVGVVVRDGKDVIFSRVYRVEDGVLKEASDKPDIVIVLERADLEDIMREYRVVEKNGWTVQEVANLEFMILEKIKFQGDLLPWWMKSGR